jgi:hypothetical protein
MCRRALHHKTTGDATSNTRSTLAQDRRTALIQAMNNNEDVYVQTKALVNDIKVAKLQKVATMKGCNSDTGVCPYRSQKNEFAAEEPFPKPVRDLFFHVPLVTSFEKTPISKLSTLDWDGMLQDARQKLDAFREYNNGK